MNIVYRGIRNEVETPLVYKNDQPLSPVPSQKLYNHSPDGLEWGYRGSGPAQLALALLLDATGDSHLSIRLHQDFKEQHCAQWQGNWEIPKEEILEWVKLQKV